MSEITQLRIDSSEVVKATSDLDRFGAIAAQVGPRLERALSRSEQSMEREARAAQQAIREQERMVRAIGVAQGRAIADDRRLEESKRRAAEIAERAAARKAVAEEAATRRMGIAQSQAIEIDKRLEEAKRRAVDAAQSGYGKAAGSVGTLTQSLGGLRSMLAGVGVYLGVRQVIEWADSWKLAEARLKLVTTSAGQLTRVQGALYDSAQRTRTSYQATAELYGRVARNAAQLGRSEADLLSFTEAVQKSIQVSGATSTEASNGVIQLSQALASGVLRGDEFRSVMEQMPGVARALALGLNVPIGALRAMAERGELTAEKVVTAMLKMKDSIDKDFANVPLTIGQAFTVLNNGIGKWIGETDKATSATQSLARGIAGLGTWIGDNGPLLKGITQGAVAFGGMALAIWGVNAALTGGVVAIGAWSAALLASPIGPFVVAAGALAAALGTIKFNAAGAKDEMDRFKNSFNGLSEKQLLFERSRTQEEMAGVSQALNSGTKGSPHKNYSVLHDTFASLELRANAIDDALARLTNTEGAAAAGTATLNAELVKANKERQLELDRLIALNAAYGGSSDQIKLINIEYDRLVARQKLKGETDSKERTEALRLADAYARQQVEAVKLARALREQDFDTKTQSLTDDVTQQEKMTAAIREGQDAVDKLTIQQAGQKAAQDALNEASQQGIMILFSDIKTRREAAEALARQTIAQRELRKEQERWAKAVRDPKLDLVANPNAVSTDARAYASIWIKEHHDRLAKQLDGDKKYMAELKSIARDGFGQIATDGLKSWRQFTEEALRMFSRLMDSMEKEAERLKALGQTSGLPTDSARYKALGYGSAVLAGLSIGSSSGPLGGAVGGAAAGFAIAPGPAGAFIGGLAGLVSGIFSESERLKKARDAFMDTLQSYVDTAGGRQGSVGTALIASQLEAEQFRKQARDLYPKNYQQFQRQALLDQINEGETRNRQKIISDFSKDLNAQLNSLNGDEFANQLQKIDDQFWDQRASIDAIYKATGDAKWANEEYAKVLEIERLSIAKVTEAHNAQVRAQREDYKVRELRALGRTDEADALAFAQSQQREYEQAVRDGADAQTLAALAAALAAEKLARATGAMDSLNQSLTNVPTGFKKFAKFLYEATQAPAIRAGTDSYGAGIASLSYPTGPLAYDSLGSRPSLPAPSLPTAPSSLTPSTYQTAPASVDQHVEYHIDNLTVQVPGDVDMDKFFENLSRKVRREASRGGTMQISKIIRRT